MATGLVVWSVDNFGVAAIILADEKLLIVKADGGLVLAKPSAQGFEKLAEKKIAIGTVRALPALANGRLLLRDESTMYCYQVGETEE